MLFNSVAFLLGFLPLALAATWLARRLAAGPGVPVLVLGAASYAFYAYGETRYPWLILASIAVNFRAGRSLARLPPGFLRRAVFVAAIAANLGTLGYFKYAGFLAANLGALVGWGAPGWTVALPIGISFFTFTQLAFLVDTYRGQAREAGPARYFLFVTFFPHLIAGPILHHGEMMPQFARLRGGSPWPGLASGMAMFAIGLFKKCVVADTLGPVATALFGHAQAGGGGGVTLLDGWMAALGYTAQIYFDFSGYCDMAIGLGRMVGVDLPINFNAPYKARTIVEFWRRWHITLSRFLRDYLYVALGGNRRGRLRRHANLLATMLLGGLWHGAGWTFVAWGGLHGVYLVAAHLWRTPWRTLAGRPRMPVPLAWALTMLAVVAAWVVFRAPDLATAWAIWGGMAGLHGITLPNWPGMAGVARMTGLPLAEMGFGRGDALLVATALLGCLVLPNSQEILARFHLGLDSPGYRAIPPGAADRRATLRRHWSSALAAGVVLGVALRYMGGASEFLYFQF